MIVIPTINLTDGRVVRLKHDDSGLIKTVGHNPHLIADRFAKAGAKRLQIVDLDGARVGYPVQKDFIVSIIKSVDVPVQVGGGIREVKDIDFYVSAGARWVVLGSRFCEDDARLRGICERYPDRIVVAVDAYEGHPSGAGWRSAHDLQARLGSLPLANILFTDMHRNYVGRGPNIESTRRHAQITSIPIIVSGGIARLSDLRSIAQMEEYGIIGVIVNNALYEGTIPLAVIGNGIVPI